MIERDVPSVRPATPSDALAVGTLLDAFNREYEEASPGPAWLAERIAQLISADTLVLLVDSRATGSIGSDATAGPAGVGSDAAAEPAGLAVLRFRASIWSAAQECYLAELYVVPEQRGRGLGEALMRAAIIAAQERGADHILLGTSEDDHAARALYEKLGFVNRERGPGGPITYFYELEL